MKPLTLDEVKKNSGKIFYILANKELSCLGIDKEWMIVIVKNEEIILSDVESPYIVSLPMKNYGEQFYIYNSDKPKCFDRKSWESCGRCRSCITCQHAIESARNENSKCFDCEHLSNYEPLNFCPHCGKPLTEKAWEILEKKFKVL